MMALSFPIEDFEVSRKTQTFQKSIDSAATLCYSAVIERKADGEADDMGDERYSNPNRQPRHASINTGVK